MLRCDDGNFVTLHAFVEECADLMSDAGIFGLIALEFAVFDTGFFRRIGGNDSLVDADVWRLTEAVFALFNDVMGEVKNFGAAAVILIE